ncbi:5'-methylthioadenosine/S-adenosylhomocysteine nucleosidase [Streptomyces sp. NY05-11A]|uniref:5'-methylthioadenosine/S-adenosylhomocysteine nucleosidase n=1 Tax=Streptomyces soliscabiei TaxID=588897 RepID=UPI0029AE0D29|nr:5'-methylthioadenosine/S-adenosylhomocysteine nucleosidase [Streptomyces sp. NY05-11A]MDX2682418.1 5'-methylthioadenosine/S-adenosylhomocysteine nucleosidase [Streptomyces sp. NY05-11A]
MSETKPTVVVLTALALEYAAVRAHIADRREDVHPDGTRVEIGRLDGTSWQVALAELGEGVSNASAMTTQLINWLRPQAVLFVGIAGSLKEDIGIGDVLVGTKVYGIQGGKWTPQGFHSRPEAWHGSNALVQAARSAVRDMTDVRPHFKPIASGDVVLADAEAEIVTFLREHYNDAAAIEMEGSGAAHAAHLNGQVSALVIRGISDHADARKSRADATGSQRLAAAQAANVAVAILRKHEPQDTSDTPGITDGQPRRGSGSGSGSGSGGDHITFRGGTYYGPVIGKITGNTGRTGHTGRAGRP